MLANLRALFGVIVDIILLRRGPEQLPASPALLVVVAVLSAVESSFMALLAPVSLAGVVLQSLVGTAVLLLWFHFALVLAGKRERFTQMMTAIIGVNVLFIPVVLPLYAALLPYIGKADPKVPPPAALSIITLLIGFWALFVEIRIVRAAFECPWIGAFLLVAGEFFAAVIIFALLFGAASNAV